MRMAKNNSFDPDQLGLTKPDILNFCDRVLEKWNKNSTPNPNHILAMNAVKTAVLWTDDESLKVIWSEIIGWTSLGDQLFTPRQHRRLRTRLCGTSSSCVNSSGCKTDKSHSNAGRYDALDSRRKVGYWLNNNRR